MPGSKPLVDGNVFTGNRANTGAGISLIDTGVAEITNNIIAGNVATTTATFGAGILVDSSPAKLVNNTIANNTGDGIILSEAENIIIVNNIVYGNVGAGLKNYSDTYTNPTIVYTADYNDVYNNTVNYDNISTGANDLSVYPQFIGSGDVRAYYHIQESSPVRHTGSSAWAPPFDIDLEARIAPVSMGADELDLTYTIYLPVVRK